MSGWRESLVESDAEVPAILADTVRIAVLGIRHGGGAEALAPVGIKVVRGRSLMVDHRRLQR